MAGIKENLDLIASSISELANTARDVNLHSYTRKKSSGESIALIDRLVGENSGLKNNFDKVYKNLNDTLLEISANSEEFKTNIKYFSNIIDSINDIKKLLDALEVEINKLTNIVEEIQNDTDEIFTLALNASIVSSKYSHTSGVFDILANKLNEMSNFINLNLENIVHVVRPINDGINKLTYKNAMVLTDFESGYSSFQEFPLILDKQKESVDELLLRAYMSGSKIDDQKKMLEDIKQKVVQMDNDATGAINGSAANIKAGESLANISREIIVNYENGADYLDSVGVMREQARSVITVASGVNEKSKSQHEFSMSCVDFCNNIISESVELKKTTEIFNTQSAENNQAAITVTKNLGKLTTQIDGIEKNIADSNKTIQQFNDDYKQIDNIVEFLKNILKSMNVIGMYSRIESARDPEEFAGFITISDNIRSLQNHIHSNIPLIEENIVKTHLLIEEVNQFFIKIYSVFSTLVNSSENIINKLGDITRISSESEALSKSILNQSNVIDSFLVNLRAFLSELTEVVKKPIEGSAANIERGKMIESTCIEILEVTGKI